MESLNNFYKISALNNAKKVPTVQILEQERKENINKQIGYMEKQLQTMYPGQDIEPILQQEVMRADFGKPTIDITDFSKVKTLEEFINESIEKDRQVVVEIGESLRELIESAPEEDVKDIETETEEQSIEEFARQSVEEKTVEETYEVPDPDEVYETSEQEKKSDIKEFVEPKYFVIPIGSEEEQKYLVEDKDGNEVGIIEDGQLEMNDDYFNSQLEKYNIDDLISTKVRNFEELQRVRQEMKPKSLEQLAEMNFDSGKEIVQRANEVIEQVQTETTPDTQEKGVLEEPEEDNIAIDEEYKEKEDTFEELDELAREGESNKIQNYLDQNSVRKLVILIPYTLTDQLDNHQLKERGEEITVYQLKGTVKPKFVLQQGDRVLYGDRYNEQIQKNMSKIPYTSGVVREVSDTETTAEVKLIDGTEHEFLVKGQERDLTQSQKEIVVARIEELSAELSRIENITPDNVVDYKIEFPGGPEEKCNRIDFLQAEIVKICNQYDIEIPSKLRSDGENEMTPKDLPEEEQKLVDSDNESRTYADEAYEARFGNGKKI